MGYYEVNVSGQSYHGHGSLTYSSEQELLPGTVVLVPMRNQTMPAVVVRKTSKPKFAAKSIKQILLRQPLPQTSLRLLTWLQEFYPAPTGSITSQFLPSNLLLSEAPPAIPYIASRVEPRDLPKLTLEQQDTVNAIASMPKQKTWLLHGNTGSGKTRVYVELMHKTLAQGRSCLILTPEIGLTSQLAETIAKAVKAPTTVIHSGQTGKQRRDAWLSILYATEPMIVIGPRSALFAPFAKLGLVVVDEAHDGAYKQEQAPYYHALRVASQLARLHAALLVFGSATPLVSEYYLAEQKQVPILRMQKLATPSVNSAGPSVVVVEQTNRSEFTKSPLISNTLIASIRSSLSKNEQSLVFLNRRGTARIIACQDCGWQATCPNCDLPLTYHADHHNMRCHTCGHKQPIVTSCPTCDSTDILYKSAGTKALADNLQRLFPSAVVKRFDTDNLKADSLDTLYQDVKHGLIDILVGTQMLIKGHDLPRLSTVGVISADASLNFPDYTSEEQTYQLLTQVIGRVGRGHRNGNVVIQTLNSSGSALVAAVNKDWKEFYKQQLAERQRYLFPPYCFILKLICRRKNLNSAEQTAHKLALQLRTTQSGIQVLGPSPSFVSKTNNYFSWQIIVKSKQRKNLLDIINNLPPNWHYDIDPSNLL